MLWDRTQLVSLKRGGVTEIAIQGEIVVHDGDRVIFQTRDCLGSYPMRSLLKPFQFLAAGIEPILQRELKYTPCLGSISATENQLIELRRWYSDPKSQKRISELKLLPCYPSDETNRVLVKARGEKPSVFYHQCFSKHLAILECCEREGWSTSDYHETHHPYHHKLIDLLSRLLQRDLIQAQMVIDGCRLPSPVLSLADMAQLYQILIGAPKNSELAIIKQKIVDSPDWIGGPDRVDTLLMQRNPGLIAKEGADGLLGLGVPPSPKYPMGLGIVVKTWAGYQPKFAALALEPILESLNLTPVLDHSPDHQVEFHYRPFQPNAVKTWDISPELSEEISVWPGDIKFRRKITFDTLKGDHMTLSSFESTVHVGAHTDGINHFQKTERGIESHSLEPYHGICQLIKLEKAKGSLIEKQDLENIQLNSKRILFKTGSFPDPNKFNEDFVAFAESAIDYLAQRGVILVGIDTPSIDPFSSKDLPAHHATIASGLRILEGIVLNQIEEGIYHLSAIPLKIKGADASPVRAILTEVQ